VQVKPISKAQTELTEMNTAQQIALQTQSNQEQKALELAQTGQQPAKPSARMEREAELQSMLQVKHILLKKREALDASIDLHMKYTSCRTNYIKQKFTNC
jgi:hypothetical protein